MRLMSVTCLDEKTMLNIQDLFSSLGEKFLSIIAL